VGRRLGAAGRSAQLIARRVRAAVADPKAWFEESFTQARQSVYTPAIGAGHGPFTLDAD
jgi:hypothetical protein